jgi:hypothetical protein
MKRVLVLAFLALLPLVFASSANAASERSFIGLWKGIDAVDGGEALHSITCFRDGACQLVATDSVVSFCGGGSAFIGGTGSLESDELVFPDAVLTCREDTVVELELRYERDRRNRTIVVTAVVDGIPFRSIVFHKISN